MQTFVRVSSKLVGLVVAGLVGLLVVGYVGRGLVGTLEVHRAEERVLADLEAGLPEARRTLVRHEERLARSVAGLGVPEHTWTVVQCSFSSNDSGWIANSYNQDCEVRAVALHATERSSKEVQRLLAAGRPAGGLHPVAGAGCETLTSGGGGPDVFARVDYAPTAELLADEVDWRCPRPLAFRTSTSYRAVRVLQGTPPESLAGPVAWVVVTVSVPVSRTEIGCSPWGVLLCTNPFDEPVMD